MVPVRALNWGKVVKSPNNELRLPNRELCSWPEGSSGGLRRFLRTHSLSDTSTFLDGESVRPRPVWSFPLPLNKVSSRPGGPQALLLHDVPQLPQVGLRDGVVRFQLQGPEVISFSVLQFPVEVQDGSQVHQGSRILERANNRFRIKDSDIQLSELRIYTIYTVTH